MSSLQSTFVTSVTFLSNQLYNLLLNDSISLNRIILNKNSKGGLKSRIPENKQTTNQKLLSLTQY